jgi:hypothetical protein
MKHSRFHGLRAKFTYANVLATLALFFALTGTATTVGKYLTATDLILAGDLAGSTYGNPVLAPGTMTTGKIVDGAVTTRSSTARPRQRFLPISAGLGPSG